MVVLVRKKDVEEQGEVFGVVVGDTVNGVLGDVFIVKFIEGVTVVSDLGVEDPPEGVFIDVGVLDAGHHNSNYLWL